MRRAFRVSRLHSTNSHSKLKLWREIFFSTRLANIFVRRVREAFPLAPSLRNGEKLGEISPFAFSSWSVRKNRQKRFIFHENASGIFLFHRMIHVYCDLYCLIDFNWLLLVIQSNIWLSLSVTSIDSFSGKINSEWQIYFSVYL